MVCPGSRSQIFQSTLSVGRGTIDTKPRKWYGDISIHPLRGERDLAYSDVNSIPAFQSTLSVGRGTRRRSLRQQKRIISIHPLRGERDPRSAGCPSGRADFNPPSPRGEGLTDGMAFVANVSFQSTLSVGRGTKMRGEVETYVDISIHPLRGERDRLAHGRHAA